MMKLDGDLEDIPRHKEFLKFFKALFIFYFSKGEAMTFFFFSQEKRPQTIPEFANIIM